MRNAQFPACSEVFCLYLAYATRNVCEFSNQNPLAGKSQPAVQTEHGFSKQVAASQDLCSEACGKFSWRKVVGVLIGFKETILSAGVLARSFTNKHGLVLQQGKARLAGGE